MLAGTGVRAGRLAAGREGVDDGRVWGAGVPVVGGVAGLVFVLAGMRGVGVALGAGVGVTGTGHK